jgi:hypothetical protein
MGSGLQVLTLDESLHDPYTSFVDSHPDARFGHDLAWARTLRQAYGLETRHLVALDGEQVVGVCPFFLSRPLIGGAHYVTNPFPTYCGPLYDSDEVLSAILEEIKTKTAVVGHAEVLTPLALPGEEGSSLPFVDKLDYTYRIDLRKGIEVVFNSLSRDNKRILRKTDSLKDMQLLVDADGRHLDAFHKLYVGIYAGKHGFIPHGKRLFRSIFRHFPPGAARIYLAKVRGDFVGAMFTFWTHHEVYYGWSAVLPDSLHHPTHFLLWRIVQDAAAEGYRWFNMGEAAREHHGLNHFKRGWATEVLEPRRYFIPGRLTEPTPRLFDRLGWTRKVIAKLPAFVVNTFLSPLIRFFL